MSLYEEVNQHEKLDGAWFGEFATAPVAENELAYVILYSFSDHHRIGPLMWSPWRTDRTPSIGDKCLVLYDENENPYVVAWWH